MILSVHDTRNVADVELGPQTIRAYVAGQLAAHLWTPDDALNIQLPERLCRGTAIGVWTELVTELTGDGWQVHLALAGPTANNLNWVTLVVTKPKERRTNGKAIDA
ncbi:MAG: hypothetical protein V1738_06510 [Patescibacteria group bacterium]